MADKKIHALDDLAEVTGDLVLPISAASGDAKKVTVEQIESHILEPEKIANGFSNAASDGLLAPDLGESVQIVYAASAGAGPIAYGKDLAGDPLEIPLVAIGDATVYDTLFGPLVRAEALHRWLTGRVATVPSGSPLIANILLPGSDAPKLNLPSHRLIQAGADFDLMVEASTDSPVQAFTGNLEMTALIESTGAADIIIGLADPDTGRLPTRWNGRTTDLTLPYGKRALAELLVRPGTGGEALIKLNDIGPMPIIPVTELYQTRTASSATPAGLTGLTVPLDTLDAVLSIWSRSDNTTIGAADGAFTAVGWSELAGTGMAGASYVIYPCWSQGRALDGALGSTGTRASCNRCGVLALRGGATMTKTFQAGTHTSDGNINFPSLSGNLPGDVIYGFSFRRGANGNGGIPPGATLIWDINATNNNQRLFRVDNPPSTYAPSPVTGVDGTSLATSFLLRVRPGV